MAFSQFLKLYLQVAGDRCVLLVVGDITQCTAEVLICPNDERLKCVDGIAAHIVDKGLHMISQIIYLKRNVCALQCMNDANVWNSSSIFSLLLIFGITYCLPVDQVPSQLFQK